LICSCTPLRARVNPHVPRLIISAAPLDQGARLLLVRREAGIRAIASALLGKESLTGGEVHQLFTRAGWPPAALAVLDRIERAALGQNFAT
jgi:hypothetical protein